MKRTPFAFEPERRLRYPWEYRRLFNKSEVARLHDCIVFRLRNALDHPRLGITIKSRGNSVERNRVKRTIREFFRKNSDRLGNFDYNVVIPASKRIDFIYVKKLRDCLAREFWNGYKSF